MFSESFALKSNALHMKKINVLLAMEATKVEQIPSTEISHGKLKRGGDLSNKDLFQMSANYFWRQAEAYHFWILAHRQLYEGQFEYASRTSLILEEYEDVIDLAHTQSLIAMASYCCRNFSRCSRSIMKLGRLDASISLTSRQFSDMTSPIFMQVSLLCHCFTGLEQLPLSV